MPSNNNSPATRARLDQRASPAHVNPAAKPKQRRQRNPKPPQEPPLRDGSPSRSAESEPTPGQGRRNKRSAQPRPQQNTFSPEPKSDIYHTQTNLQPSGHPTATATPKRSTAYAGPTFHASPAASALPIPKFFAKSAQRPPSQPESSASSDTGSSPISSPPSPTPVSPSRGLVQDLATRQESPLDILFKADREERARKLNSQGNGNPLSPPLLHSSSPPATSPHGHHKQPRSEERRVGKECRN